MSAGVVIVGAGQAGGALAGALRVGGYTEPVTIIGTEPLAPYQRPPLSKAWLKGEAAMNDLLLRPLAFYAEKNITLKPSSTVVSIDRAQLSIRLDDGATMGYDKLVLATGSRLRALAVDGARSSGVFELRSVADAERIKAALGPGKRLVVVGGGYIGLEVAASARTIGAEVVVIEREARLLARVASATLSDFFARCHADHGVTLVLGATVSGFEQVAGAVSGVRLADGRVFPCDAAVVGIGALANDALARDAGLACDDGVIVNAQCRTSDDAIYAIGDCTRRPVPRYDRMVRLESVPNAIEQAKQAAADIGGKPPPKADAPWFWSDQYDVKLQMAGMPFDVASTVVRGDPAAGKFAIFLLDAGGSVRAVEAINAPGEFMAGKLLVASRKTIASERLADTTIPMKTLLG